MTNPENETSVRVSLRIRPQSAAEKIEMCRVCTHVAEDHPQVILGKDKAFTYDHVFNMESKQPQIYDDTIRSLVEGCLEGYNATVLAYGQTGSGKTYTMGTGFDVSIAPEDEGIIPRAVTQLFDSIEEEKFAARRDNRSPPQFSVGVQFMELYNEELVDLFDFDNRKNSIKIHEDSNGNIYTVGVTRRTVTSAQETLGALQQGALSRTTASTNMNAQSSRSHAIFTIHLTHNRFVKPIENESVPVSDKSSGPPPEMETLTAKFNFVDLAGSERLKRTGATGDRAKEGISINCGLLALGNVISALGDVTKRGCHVPYRDSKLTRLLQDSLGGNSRTLMIACISPSDRDFMETLNTLKYANRARNIKNKVVVNQDKASKQIAALRSEIQNLTVELMEYRQGRRVSTMSDQECVSDLSQENNLLKTENDKLRLRIKALQQTIDNQSSRITDFASAQVMANFGDEEANGEVEGLIQKYLKEIEELRNKLTESEAMAVAITRHAALKSRITTPPHPDSTTTTTILEEAKLELAKQKQKAQRLEIGSAKPSRDVDQTLPDSKNATENGDELSDDDNEDDEDAEEEEDGENDDDDQDDEDDDEEDEDDVDIRDDMSEDLAELSNEISMKQKLIQELETSQKKIQNLKSQYEDKLSLLQKKIRDTETERDQVLKSVKNQEQKADQIKGIRKEYEKKLSHLQAELKQLQSAKKEHARMAKQKAQNEQQLRMLQNDVSVLKKNKVQLMRQMKDEAARNKQQEAKRTKEIAQLRKESRMQELALRNMENERRQKDKILKRREEEVNALKRLQRPISGQLGQQRSQQPTVNGVTSSSQQPRNQASRTVGGGIPRPRPPGRRSATEHATRNAKKKWTLINKKITSLVMQRQTVSNMEADMNRWIRDRDRVSKQLDRCQRNNEDRAKAGRDTSACQEQLEALSAHMDYIQENITDCQTTIMEIEEQGDDTTQVKDFISSSTPTEARILLESFLAKVIELGQESIGKEITIKEMEGKVEAMKQHNHLQQELLQHVLQASPSLEAPNKADTGSGQELAASLGMDTLMGSMTSLNSFKDEPTSAVDGVPRETGEERPKKDKARRRTGTSEEFLYPDRVKTRSQPALPVLPALSVLGDRAEPDGSAMVPALPLAPSSPPDVSKELVQKVRELQQSIRAHADENAVCAPDDAPNGKTSRSNSLNTVYGPLPPSLVRGNVKSKSARNFNNAFSFKPPTHAPLKKSRSQPSSPVLRRRPLPDKDRGASTGSGESDGTRGSENVFDRLTGNLGVEPDPDVGRMLPLRPPSSKPAALVCAYAATGHNSSVLAVDVTDDLMFTGSKDRTVKMWDLNIGEETASLGGHKREVVAVRFCPRTHCVFSASQNIVKVWDIREDPRRGMRTLAPPSSSSLGSLISSMTSETQINDIKLGAGGTHLYVAMEKTVRIWDLSTNSMTGKLGGHTGIVMAVVVSQMNNNTVVYTGSRDHYVKVYEVNSARVGVQPATSNLEPPHYDGVQSLGVHGNSVFSGSRDNSIKKWDVTSRQLQQHLTGAHKDWVCALGFLSPHNVLLSGCRGGSLKLWQMDTCSQICEIKAHKHPINAIATNSSCVFTASSDRLVRLWRVSGTLEEQLGELGRAVQV